ncbi:MAG: ATP-binding protein [Eubacteriales bacterium]
MKELSLHILDVAKNSVKAGASVIGIEIVTDSRGIMRITITDNGCGMSPELLVRVTDPFCTTRTTRKVGLGLPLLKLAAEQTGGGIEIESSTEEGKSGTRLTAVFDTTSIDCMPMGDIVSTVCTLVAGSPDIDFVFSDISPQREVSMNTADMRRALGEGISLAEPEVIKWLGEYLEEQYSDKK